MNVVMEMASAEILLLQHAEPLGAPVITLISLLIILSIITVLGSGIVILVVLKDPCHNLRSQVATMFVFNLAIADLLVGLFIEPICVVYLILSLPEEGRVFQFGTAVLTFAVKASCLSLVALGIERWIVVEMPLRSRSILTPRRVAISIVVIWLLACAIASTRYLEIQVKAIDVDFFIFDIIGSILFITLICVYGRILVVVRRSTSFRMQFKTSTNTNKGEKQPLIAETQAHVYIRRERTREAKVTRTFYIVCGTFLLCWLPSTLYINIYREHHTLAFKYCLLAGLLHSALNPVIYSLKSERFKQALRKMLRRNSR